jgi:hypothetical protein
VAATILTLQTLLDLSDAETAEAAQCDLRWKVATGMALDHKGFHRSTLTYWRRRLAKSKRPHRINEAIRKIVEETGLLRGRHRRAVDSTILADAVATQDTITQLVAAVRRVARQVPGAAEQIAAVCRGHDYSTPGKPSIDWDDPAAKDALVSALVNDANALIAALADAELDEAAQAALGLLALVAGQDGLRVLMAPTGGGASLVRWPKSGSYPLWTLRLGTPASRPRRAGTAIGPTWPPNPTPASSPTRN